MFRLQNGRQKMAATLIAAGPADRSHQTHLVPQGANVNAGAAPQQLPALPTSRMVALRARLATGRLCLLALGVPSIKPKSSASMPSSKANCKLAMLAAASCRAGVAQACGSVLVYVVGGRAQRQAEARTKQRQQCQQAAHKSKQTGETRHTLSARLQASPRRWQAAPAGEAGAAAMRAASKCAVGSCCASPRESKPYGCLLASRPCAAGS